MKPVVSVLITTYNHEPFIERALQSVLDQQVDFEVEILVGEDCSTDRTPAILGRLLQTNPAKFRIVNHGVNVGGHENFARLWLQARGDYIAWLEGDDFWIDSRKLQKQVELMRMMPDASLCFTRCQIVAGPDADFVSRSKVAPKKTGFNHLATGNYIHTPTVLYRRGVVDVYPEWIKSLPLGDWPLHLLHAKDGSIAYLDDTTAAYRVHLGGAWSRRGRAEQISETRVVIESLLSHVRLSSWQRLSLRATDARLEAELIRETRGWVWPLLAAPAIAVSPIHFFLRGLFMLTALRHNWRTAL